MFSKNTISHARIFLWVLANTKQEGYIKCLTQESETIML